MKMNYLPKNNKYSSQSKKIIFLTGVFLLSALFFSLFDNFIIKLISPIWKAENYFSRSIGRIGESIKTRRFLARENLDLREKVASLEIEIRALRLLVESDQKLFEMLGRTKEGGGIMTSVLTHPPQSPYDLVVIDAGENNGIISGDLAYLPEGPILGRVIDVNSSFSKIKFFTSAGEKTDAVLERNNLPVVLEGMGAGNFRIEVPRDVEVNLGDRIISSDIRGSLMAVVGDVLVEPTASFKEVIAISPVNIFTLRYIKIVP